MGTRTQRISGRRGVELRRAQLEREPLCRHCRAEGKYTEATRVDHIVALVNGGSNAQSNLQSLCERHHNIKTGHDVRQRDGTEVPEIGLDGYPVEL